MPQLVRDAGVWKPVRKKFIRDAGVWKPVSTGFVRDSNIWKKFFVSEVGYVGDAANNGTSVTTPSETLAGDLLVVFVTGQLGNYPAVPTGWNLITQAIQTNRTGRMMWRLADADGAQLLSGFTNSQWTSVSVFRNAEIGANDTRVTFSPTLILPQPTLQNTDETSWILLGVAISATSNHSSPPAPYILRQSRPNGPTVSLFDTNGPVSSAPSGNISISGNQTVAIAVEIKVAS